MRINYRFGEDLFKFSQMNKEELSKLNFVIANSRGDFLNLGVESNSCKYQGFNLCGSKNVEIFKFIESVNPTGLDIESIHYLGYKVIRKFKSKYEYKIENYTCEDTDVSTDLKNVGAEFFSKGSVRTTDSFFVSPTGGLMYNIKNFEGSLFVDLDMRKKNDFDKWGRDYKVFKDGDTIFVEYTKTTQNAGNNTYKMFLAIRAVNFAYDLKEEFVKREYEYSKAQKTNCEWYVYRLLSVNVLSNKRIFFGCGFSREEAKIEVDSLFKNWGKLESGAKENERDIFSKDVEFFKPLTQNIKVAYDLSESAMYKFLNKDLNNSKVGIGCYTGFPYFTNVWSRDDIYSLSAFIDMGDFNLVKSRINFYLENFDSKTGGLRNLLSRDGESSCDILLFLVKRIEDFIFKLIELDIVSNYYSKADLREMYLKLNLAFNSIVKYNWDFDEELIKVKNKNSFRDSTYCEFPLNVQVMFLKFVSFMTFLAKMSGNKNDIEKFADFEDLLVQKIRLAYFRKNNLRHNLKSDKVSFDVFSAYYFYPALFTQSDWETIFDNALKVLINSWNGVSSLSKLDKDFISEHSGGNRVSRSRGDSFYYMNNLTAIVLNDINEQKYRRVISKIVLSSTRDILVCGTIGFGSELSSSSVQKSEGNLAQLTSSASYLEMIDKVFERKN